MTFSRTLLALLALVLLLPAGVLAQTPTVTTNAATAVTDVTVTLNGTINPNGTGTCYPSFDLGTTTSYGTSVTANPVTVAGSTATAVTTNYSGLQPSTTYHYRLRAYNGSQNIYGTDATFTTGPAATPPTVTNPMTSSSISNTSAEIGNNYVFAGGSTTTVVFEYGTTTSYGSSINYYTTITTAQTTSVSTNLTGLIPSTTYHYRVQATNAQGTAYSTDSTFTTLPNPIITTGAATAVTDLSATLNGSITPNGGSFSSNIEWGTTTSYGSSNSTSPSGVSGSGTTAVSLSATNLLPSTTYHFRVMAWDSNAQAYVYGADQTFTTGAPATPPTINGNLSIFSIGTATATAQVNVSAGSSTTAVAFDYGATTAYGSTATYGSTFSTDSTSYAYVNLTGLTPGTTYHIRARATNGQGTTSTADTTFTTLAAPVPTTQAATGVTDIAAVLNGSLSPNGTSVNLYFEYGTTASYGYTASTSPSFVSGSNPTAITGNPSGLQPNTTYHYRLTAEDSSSNYYHGSDMTFTTGAPATLPTLGTLSASYISSTQAQVQVNTVNSGGSSATVVFDYGPTTAYGTSITYSTTIPTNTTFSSPSTYLKGLTPNTIYHYRVRAINGQGTTTSSDATFTTLPTPILTTTAATAVSDITATINGTANAQGGSLTMTFEYGTSASYGSSPTIGASPFQVSGSTTTSVSNQLTRLQPNTTYHYRIRSYDGGAYTYGADATFTTSAPATPPTIGSPSATSVTASAASLEVTGVSAGSSPTTLVFDYGLNTSYGASANYSALIQTSTSVTSPTVTLSGLTPATTYHYRGRATNGQGVATSADATFTTLPAPTVTTLAATGVTDIAAAFNGSANANGGLLYVSFDYGTTANYGSNIYASTNYVSGSTTVSESASPSGLLPSTTYHFRMKGVDGNNVTYYGSDMTFTTASAATPPTVGTVTASATARSARLQVSSVSAGSSPATIYFDYGPTTAYGSTAIFNTSIATNTTYSSPSVTVMGLAPATLYHFRCKAINSQGTTYSADGTFTTLPAPVITTMPATGVVDIAATLNGTVNPNGSSLTVSFQYGTDTSYGSTAYTSPSSASGTTTVTESASPYYLQPNTTYHYRVVAYDSNNYYYYGADTSFTTTPISSPPSLTTGSASPVSATSATISANSVSAGGSPANLIFDYGTTSSYGSQAAYPYLLSINTTYGTESVTLTGLTPATTYHYRARAVNGVGTVVGADATFATLPLPTVTTGLATGVTDLAATLNGTANANTGSYQVAYEYGPTTAYGSSVGATPSSASGTSSLSPTASPPGLLPNTTYHYRLRLSDNLTSYYGADATFTTLAPGTPPTATTAAAVGMTATTAILNATTVSSGSSPTSIVFDYGTTASYGSTLLYETEMANASYNTIQALLTGLQPQTTYHFRVRATNAQGTATGADMTFTTLGLPTLTTNAATNVTDLGATLNASVNPAGVPSTVKFEYGPTTSYGSSITLPASPVSGMNPLSESTVLSGSLTPLTTYHYRVRLDNIDGTYYGADATFNTAAPGTAPSIGSVNAYNLGANGALLSASTVSAGSSPANLAFDYGLTSSYGQQAIYPPVVPAETTLGSARVALTGLLPNTTYHFRARATNSQGTSYGADNILTTTGQPVVATAPASSVTDVSAVLNGTATPNGTSLTTYFQYGTTTAYGSTSYTFQTTVFGNGSFASAAGVSGLQPNTTYHYRFSAQDSAGEIINGADQTFVTASPSTLPTIATDTPTVQATSATLWAKNISAGASPATVSWDYGLTTAYGASIVYPYTFSTGANNRFAPMNVNGLTPSTTYHYRAVITNAQGTVYGTDVMFTTPATSVTATTLPATQIRSTSATLNGSYQTDVSGGTVTFDYGLDTNYGQSANALPSLFNSNTVSAPLTGLTPGTTYHFRLVNTTPSGTAYGADMTFTTLATGAPVALTGTALASAGGGATVLGVVNASGLSTTAVVEYGQTTSYGSVSYVLPTPVSGNTDTAVNTTISGLSQYATYHYRIVATNAQGTTYGDDATVTIVQPAQAITGTATSYSTEATLNGTILNSSYNTYVSNAYFEYGTTTAYGTVLTTFPPYYYPANMTVFAYAGALYFGSNNPPLQPNTTYHYRLVVISNGGTSYGNDATFTTDYAAPTLAYQPVTGLTASGATLNATVTETGATDSVNFDYGLDNTYGTTVAATPATVSGTGATPVSVSLSGLAPGITYHYRVWASRSFNGQTETFSGSDQTFTTLTLLDNWKQQNFGTNANSGPTADTASFVGDGVANLVKYALGLDPTVQDANLLPSAIAKNYGGTNYLSYTFPRDPTKTDLTYEVISADNPSGPWTTIASSVAGSVTSGPGFVSETPAAGGLISVEVHDTVSIGSASQRYLRLRVTH